MYENYVWKRAEFLFNGKDFNVFVEGADENDVHQKQLNDCYYLAAVSSIAENPDRIKFIFLTRDRSERGQYKLIMHQTGIR